MSDLSPPIALLLKLDDMVRAATNWWTGMMEELMFLFATPAERERVNDIVNAVDPLFQVDGAWYAAGLRPWEASLIERAELAPNATIVVGGAGAGRELVALAERGYRALGFDPNATLVDAGQSLVSASGARLALGGYEDLIDYGEHGTGRLSSLLAGERVDAFFFAWGSLTYVRDGATRKRLLEICHRLAPDARLLVSFPSFPPAPPWHDGGPTRRPLLRRWLWSSARGKWPATGERFFRRVGFATLVDLEVLEALATETGYSVEYGKLPEYAHAILRPASAK